MKLKLWDALVTAGLFVLSYLIGEAIYRLYFSPLSKFPGPKLAALSRWYEFYYDVILQGQFTFHIQDLHKKYGPIVRITPEEIHIQDSDFFDELYSRGERRDKYEATAGRFGNNSSMFTTSSHALHSQRRAPLNPMFSKRSIANFQRVIREKLDILVQEIEQQYKATKNREGKDLNLTKAIAALSGDIICEYCFGFGYNHLQSPGFDNTFHEGYIALSAFGHVAVQFPWVHALLNALPDWLVLKMTPAAQVLLVLKSDLAKKITQIKSSASSTPKSDVSHRTIFNELLNSSLAPEEKSLERLTNEAQTIIGAGLETVTWALSIIFFHIIDSPSVYSTLNAELKRGIPDPMAQLDWTDLEKLPYLTGCIKEGLRLSYGISSRQQRVTPDRVLKYKEWTIPQGTPVSMTIVDVSHDERVYPDSHVFKPERWMSEVTGSGEGLNRYFVTFGKDSRSCLGINLAYAEMYLILATLFSRYSFDLYETDISDVVLAHDFFLPSPKLSSVGVRVKVQDLQA